MKRKELMSTQYLCEVLIIGAGGHGKELLSYIRDLAAQGERVRVRGFVDENKSRGPFSASEILGGFDDLRSFLQQHTDTVFRYITAVGDNQVRENFVEKIESLKMKSLTPWTLHHPRAIVGHNAEIGAGSCLAPGSIITTQVKMGKHCILNVNASISHDCVIGDFTNINPGAVICGNVRIGHGCYIGAGATIIDKVSIGEWTVVGAGAVVIDDLPDHVTAVGVPATIIKHSSAPTF
jgi:sugar O-acyltransferase (sialic acid O-acetyltransferase NeuD family)